MIRPAACLLLAALPATLSAQPGETARGSAQAQVVQPLSIEPTGDLRFGSIAVAAGRGGSVAVDPRTGGTAYAGAAGPVCADGAGCGAAPASFVIRGGSGRQYRLTLPDTVTARSADAPGVRLTVDALTAYSTNRTQIGRGGVLDANGRDRLQVGGTLRIPAGDARRAICRAHPYHGGL